MIKNNDEIRLIKNISESALRATLFFPNRYYTGMSSLAFQGLYSMINSVPGWAAERYFSDTFGKYTIDNEKLVSDSDIIAVTMSYELDIINLIELLKRFSIPIDPHKRNRFHPLIISGGALTYFNHRIISVFSDLTFLGDGDSTFKNFLKDCSENGCSRERIWQKYSKHENIVVPEISNIIKTPCIEISRDNPFTSSIVTPNTELSNMFLVELSRGCKYRCQFCAVGNNFGEYREFDKDKIISSIKNSGLKKVGLVAANAADYPMLEQLLFDLDDYIEVSFSSLRLDTISEKIIRSNQFNSQKSITVGLESGSERIRKIIGKNISTERLLKNLQKIGEIGKRELKYYVMYGLPEENEEDLKELLTLVLESEKIWKHGNITVSLNPFVSMPKTEWENKGFDLHILKKKVQYIKNIFKKSNSKAILKFQSVKQAALQHKIANSDPKNPQDLLEILMLNVEC